MPTGLMQSYLKYKCLRFAIELLRQLRAFFHSMVDKFFDCAVVVYGAIRFGTRDFSQAADLPNLR
jgi:hypothetical protein